MLARQQTLQQTFCEAFKARRLALGLTQVEVAERMGTYQPNVANMERGLTAPTLSTIEAAAKALKTTPLALLR